MDTQWTRRKILIWGKTRPEVSKTYREIVCTGGVFADTKRLVRLYPIPLKYLDDDKAFNQYQWIEVDVKKTRKDVRPESYRVRFDSISTLEVIPPGRGNWDARAEWVMNSENIFQSVEALQERQANDHTSLGLVKPKKILDVRSVQLSPGEREEFWQRYHSALEQMDLPLSPETGSPIKPMKPPDYRFKVRFTCDDSRCVRSHDFSILDWGLDALYFRQAYTEGRSRQMAAAKVVEKLQDQVFAPDKDLYFFLGNIASHPKTFTVVGLWWPKKKKSSNQMQLF